MSRFGHGLVVGKFYPPHRGHELLIRTAAARCDRVTVVVAMSKVESIALELRLRWLREIHADLSGVRFVGRHDEVPVDYGDSAIWDAHCAIFRDALGEGGDIDAVFSSEAYGDELARRFGADHVAVDVDRCAFDVSGRAVRADPVGHWRFLRPPVRGWFCRRVVVIGAESTGTTTVATSLAERYRRRGGVWSDTQWVAEYGRELSERKLAELRRIRPAATMADVEWSRGDFVEVARTQTAAIDAAARRGSPLVVCDTDAFATAVWEERYLGSTSAAVESMAARPDLYLLTHHDGVPFVDDGLRDGEHIREWMTDRFQRRLAAAGIPVVSLTGPLEARLDTALAACDELIGRGWCLTDPP